MIILLMITALIGLGYKFVHIMFTMILLDFSFDLHHQSGNCCAVQVHESSMESFWNRMESNSNFLRVTLLWLKVPVQ